MLRMSLLALVVIAAVGCGPAPKTRCVVRVYRPDGVLHREYHGSFLSFDGGLPPIHNTRGGAAWVWLDGRTIDAAAGWQIEVDHDAEENR